VLRGLNWIGPAHPPEWRPLEWRGLHFPNRLGIAGGVDKNAENIKAWWALGAGFVEIGTVTPLAQKGNTPPVLDRDIEHEALWNRLGFPSEGVKKVRRRLESLKRPFATPIFANIGKNATTPLDQAHTDYLQLLGELSGLIDGFVINISSPNTKGLRELLKPENLRGFLQPIMEARRREPMFLKLSPDMQDSELNHALEISSELGIDGWILTNTSQGLRDGLNFPKEGGVSGRPLGPISKETLRKAVRWLGRDRRGRLVVSVGGVMSAEDVTERLELGADLVQVYSALIFEGPLFFRRVAKCQRANPQ
jgi:dihydroorotate dehydrogenase